MFSHLPRPLEAVALLVRHGPAVRAGALFKEELGLLIIVRAS